MKLRLFSLTTLILGLLSCAVRVIAPVVIMKNEGMSIIGGADLPTYMHVSMNGVLHIFMPLGVALIITALFCLIFPKTVKASCTVKTTLISLMLSAVGASGLICVFMWFTISVFNESAAHPIRYPTSMAGTAVCLGVFVMLIALYTHVRKSAFSIKGYIIDIFTSIIYLPAFLFTVSYICEILSELV